MNNVYPETDTTSLVTNEGWERANDCVAVLQIGSVSHDDDLWRFGQLRKLGASIVARNLDTGPTAQCRIQAGVMERSFPSIFLSLVSTEIM